MIYSEFLAKLFIDNYYNSDSMLFELLLIIFDYCKPLQSDIESSEFD